MIHRIASLFTNAYSLRLIMVSRIPLANPSFMLSVNTNPVGLFEFPVIVIHSEFFLECMTIRYIQRLAFKALTIQTNFQIHYTQPYFRIREAFLYN